MTDLFRTHNAMYDESSDVLHVPVYLAKNESISVECDDYHQSTFRFQIRLDFAQRAFEIRSMSPEAHSPIYPARILAAYVDAFSDAYQKLPHESSPADVHVDTFSVSYH